MLRIGVDLGGTKTEGILMDCDGAIRHRERRPTPAAAGYEAILLNVAALVRDLEAYAASRSGAGESRPATYGAGSASLRVGRSRPPASRDTSASLRVGVGTPGAISTRTGLLKNSNTVCLNGRPIKRDLERLLAREVRIANDANCFALSEALDGAARDAPVVFGVILGTGVGGGVVVNGQIVEGLQHIAGEWGHNVLEPDGPECYCGKRGCVETLLSGPGLLAEFRRHGGDAALDTRAIVEQAARGEARAEAAMQRYLDRFARALSVVINILDPHAIVLGGGMSNIDRLYGEGRARIANYLFNDELRTPILRNLHGDSSGVRGAAQLWPATAT